MLARFAQEFLVIPFLVRAISRSIPGDPSLC